MTEGKNKDTFFLKCYTFGNEIKLQNKNKTQGK